MKMRANLDEDFVVIVNRAYASFLRPRKRKGR